MLDKIFPKYVNTKNVAFIIVTVLLLVFISKIRDIAILFFASFVISCSLESVVKRLLNIFPKLNRNQACAITLIAFIFGILSLFLPIFIIGGKEIHAFAISFPHYIDSVKEFAFAISNFLKIDFGGVLSSVSNYSADFLGNTINIGKNIGSGIVYLIISILIIYYFMIDKETVKGTILKMFPNNLRVRTSEIYDTIFKKIGGYVVAQVATMASVGIIVMLGLLILRVDYALLLGLITAIFDFVPVVGPFVAFLICLIATYKYGWFVILSTAIIFIVAQLVENNFVRPYVFSKFLNLHPLVIFLFLLICAKFMGVVGVLFAPAIAATFVVLVEDLYMKTLEQN